MKPDSLISLTGIHIATHRFFTRKVHYLSATQTIRHSFLARVKYPHKSLATADKNKPAALYIDQLDPI